MSLRLLLPPLLCILSRGCTSAPLPPRSIGRRPAPITDSPRSRRRPPPLSDRAAFLSRRAAAAAALPLLPALLLPSPPASAREGYDLETAFALTAVLDLRAMVLDVDRRLFAGLLRSPPATSVTAEEGAGARAEVRRLLAPDVSPRERVRDALSLARKARRIELCSAGRGCAATEAEEHAREAQERLAAILEYGAFDGRRTNALNEPVPLMTPDELRFVHRALVSAQRELTAAFDCFGADERREAARFAARAAKGDLVPLGLDAQARQILDGQDRAIGDAIRGLGGPPPSLYADDLQRQNDALLAGSDGR
ncbi:hypothetical protein EMIHUDRAFT_436736 [Emiliania huxleyi CCMP1516]|uniref:Uncharacterized protein n=2 Tax=Emiliania huxleyi TaxID=2903 RepID=A0A0D3IWS5_EMIH1|nr:hypothetical protein EMIHUDRAFT_436736 [Emiliania huxleyi CCMP1516]EOD15710.1 hypothetical protein EMIHUDRAFT_436736 [Emiliania huxleyi CCMP1516]|eukprot:XP_005768139.1 hypothetical protein EMIHUDRAFT_436736 [Emiliania huxleyi CCMP1516]